jgi:EmrB/QacA subfamily drug resistance transporter
MRLQTPSPPLSLGQVWEWRRLLVEPSRPDAVRSHPKAPTLAVLAVCIGAFMGQLDASIVNLAYPALRTAFPSSIADVQWVGLSYLLVLVATLTAIGRFSDIVGHKLVYVYGFVVFGAGSLLCALAPNLVLLDVFRGVQALGAAMLQANSVAIITHAVPRERLGSAIGLQGAAQATGLGLGPAVGGLLVGAGGWRLVFLVNVPAAAIGLVMGWFLIPRTASLEKRAPFDWIGLAWFVPCVAGTLLALSSGAANRPLVLPICFGVLAVLCAARFLERERRTQHPLVDLALFSRRSFSVGIATAVLSYVIMFGVLFVTPFALERGLGQSPARAGLELTVFPLALAITAPFAGLLTDRRGPRSLTVTGLVTASIALVLLAVDRHDLVALLIGLAFFGLGLGAVVPANNADVMAAAPRSQSGLASGILNSTRGLGTALGVAMGGFVLSTEAGSASGAGASGPTAALALFASLAIAGVGIACLRPRRGDVVAGRALD